MKENIEKHTLNAGYTVFSNKSDKKISEQLKNQVIKSSYNTISVIMTFYNAEQFIGQAVNSVLVQYTGSEGKENFKIEFILVDDKSTDNSRNIVESMVKEFNSKIKNNYSFNTEVKIIEPETNLGCGGARKFGIEHASGDYYMFLDADDYYINADFIMRAHETIRRGNYDIVEYGMRINSGTGEVQNTGVSAGVDIIDNPRLAELAIFRDNVIKFNVWTKIYKADIIKSFPYSDSRTFEDVRTIPIWVKNAKRIRIEPGIEINYRSNSASIIRNDIITTRLGTITAIASLFETFKTDIDVMKAMYGRAMVDLTAILHNHSSDDEGFIEMSKLNTDMLRYIYKEDWMKVTFNPDIEEYSKQQIDFIQSLQQQQQQQQPVQPEPIGNKNK